VGQWWDPEPASQWADEYMRRFPGTRVQIIEAEFKDFYIPRRSMALTDTDTVITRDDIL
jgi:hypothetical protein